MKKKLTRKLSTWAIIMTTQLVIYYRLIATDLSKQTKLKDPQQISFIGKLLRNTGATMFFIIEKSEETILIFHKILSQS